VITLQRWDREGILKANRTPTNRRFYTDEHIKRVLGIKDKPRRKVAYLRVSSQAQKPDLENQKNVLASYCEANGLVVEQWIAEIGGGLNFKRPKFLGLMTDILNGLECQ
jgi:predicted site-specific integrase-resolvase